MRLPGLGRVQLSVMCGCERCGGGGAVVLLQTATASIEVHRVEGSKNL